MKYKMKKQSLWILLSFIFSFLIGVICSVSFNGTLVRPIYQMNDYIANEMSVYDDTKFDFLAYSPVESQISEMEAETSIKSVFPYFHRLSTISKGSKSYDTSAVFSTHDNVSISQYIAIREKQSLTSLPDNAIFLDEKSALEINANLGDEIILQMAAGGPLTFSVAKIYATDTLYPSFTDANEIQGSVYFPYVGENRSLIEAAYPNGIKIHAVMIEAENYQQCRNYLSSYIPLGAMMTRDDFDTDAGYNNYVENFMLEDHSDEVVEKSSLRTMQYEKIAINNNLPELVDQNTNRLRFSNILLTLISIPALFGLNVLVSLSWGKKTLNRQFYGISLLTISISIFVSFYGSTLLVSLFNNTTRTLATNYVDSILDAYINPSLYIMIAFAGVSLIILLTYLFRNPRHKNLISQKKM